MTESKIETFKKKKLLAPNYFYMANMNVIPLKTCKKDKNLTL